MIAATEISTAVVHVATAEDLFAYIKRTTGAFDISLYRQLLGACNEYKEADEALHVAADDESRRHTRSLLAQTHIADIDNTAIYSDPLHDFIRRSDDKTIIKEVAEWTLSELCDFLLKSNEDGIKRIAHGLSSDVIACAVKLLDKDQLIAVGSKVFHLFPGTKVGARGYMGDRIQPNSPTDNVDDIRWQVFDGFAYAVGDVVLCINPVSSEVESVAAVERTLADILQSFGLQDFLPHCVLAHVDVQAAVEEQFPGTTGIWFQSLGGVEDANRVFDISTETMIAHAKSRSGKYGMYFEIGQGADATNGHGKGFDMVIHESRKYGFARALTALTPAQAAIDTVTLVQQITEHAT